ncbi:DNA-binding FadR family transcriptional regulator [Thermocatellispora tengchongensis]|uniref:DNA-binding FadR family transcriptional regulator n=1 Tax=Thermocatellispora tengchongensis TaxID=1073253 RepID=A0A840PLM4_9ACTN|nr:FadR/GntR family transcriptional regulator [Thermocatellispora tengchongensis]MBB5139849.1 DNA-binding FadR family transcriptional regulator [Thermocatellispora tengchongensis]
MPRADDVVNSVKRMILEGVLRPGDRLPVEKELADSLGVSRGSLREGISALSMPGVVDTRQGDGTYITNLDVTKPLAPMGFVVDLEGRGNARHVHAVRRIPECEAARPAAGRITGEALSRARALLDEAIRIAGEATHDHERIIEIDIEFHRVIAMNSGNPVLAGLLDAFAGRTVRARLWRSLHEEGADRRTHGEHLAIWKALAARDPERAWIRMANHLMGVEESLYGLSGDMPPST